MKVPDWMKMPLAALGWKPAEVEECIDARDPTARNALQADEMSAVVNALETLFAANLLNLELQDGPVREGETFLVRGMLMRVSRVQERRLMLELPPGRKFRRPEDGRLIVAAPRKAG